ncbi:hypothetical protein TWF696_003262 [Orbilia brochopaga]|uniref:Uncharacterized protein n=1 Tax=Orbilia brochopaga TaxID=3140254 RepID=A0AAV9U057_9PEZI
MASKPFVSTRVRSHTAGYLDPKEILRPGQIIFVALDPNRATDGPYSDAGSNASSTYDSPWLDHAAYRMVLIRNVIGKQRDAQTIYVYPIMSFNNRKHLPPAGRIFHRPVTDILRLLPLPHAQSDGALQAGWREAPTPAGFGRPIDCGNWLDQRPSWLWAEALECVLSPGDTVSLG